MTPERWQRIDEILSRARELPAGQRRECIEEACSGDEELCREVDSLMAYDDRTAFFDEPAFNVNKAPDAGRRIGPYRILRKLGHGGMGAVHLAVREDGYEQRVALKLIHRGLDSDEVVRRFHVERQILASLEHPNITRILDGGTTDDGRPYFVMEYVEGEPIDRYCAEQGLSVRRKLELFREVCSAVQLSHRHLVVHRDLKPGNVLVTAGGVPKLLDFGIAKLLQPGLASQALHTAPNGAPMTPRYASPEQVAGEHVTTASDVYSLGVLLYELLAGRGPYRLETGTDAEVARAIREQEPEKPSTAVPLLAGDLDAIVAKAMRKEPQHRYGSVEQLSEDLRRHLEGLPVAARKGTFTYRAGKFLRRNRLALAVAAVVLLLVAGGAATWVESVRQRERAELAEQGREQAHRDAESLRQFIEEDLFGAVDPVRAQGKEVTALEILERGRKQLGQSMADSPELRATLAGTLGVIYRRLGAYDEARPLLEESLRIRRETFGADDVLVAKSLHNLASVLRSMGDQAAAEPLLREAVAIQRRHYPEAHPDLARGLNNLAAFLAGQGAFGEALGLFRECLAMQIELFDDHHPDVVRTRSNLASVLADLGQHREAVAVYREILKIRREVSEPSAVAKALNNLGTILRDLGEHGEAEGLLREALEIRQAIYETEHPFVASSLDNLGTVLHARGKLEEAERLLRQGLEIRRAILASNHVSIAKSLVHLGAFLQDTGRRTEAEETFGEALDIQIEAWGENHPKVAETRRLLADTER